MEHLKNSFLWVWFTTIYVVLYIALIESGFVLRIAFFIFSLSPFLIILMVIRVLKDKNECNKTFDECFYLDKDFKRCDTKVLE